MRIVLLIVGALAFIGCGSGLLGMGQTDAPAHKPAATEAEALQRCAGMAADRQAECIQIVKTRFHDTSK